MLPKNIEEVVYQAVAKGLIEVHEDGTVWRTAVARTNRITRMVKVYPCFPHRIDPSVGVGYRIVHVTIEGKQRSCPAHRLVWRALRGSIQEGMVINHKNGIKSDNRPENLEVVTYSENMEHAYRTGLADEHGERNPSAKLTDAEVEQIRIIYATGAETQEKVGMKFGVAYQTVSQIVRGERRKKQAGPTGDYVHRRVQPDRSRNLLGQFT